MVQQRHVGWFLEFPACGVWLDLDSNYHSRSKNKKESITPSSVDYMEKFVFLCWYHTENLSSSDDIYSDSSLCWASYVWSFFLTLLMLSLTLADDLCCPLFVYSILCWFRCPKIRTIGTNSIEWAQVSRFHLKTETESSLRNVVFYIKTGRWIMFKNIIVALIYHRQRLLDLVYYWKCFIPWQIAITSPRHSSSG
jgi:hypothetical protein